MLWEKVYPHAIIMRKGLIIVALGFLIALAAFLAHLISKSSITSTKAMSDDKIHTYPTENDLPTSTTSSSDNKQSQSTVNHTQAKSNTINKSSSLTQTSPTTVNNTQNVTANDNGDDLKTMSAPIDSNQITESYTPQNSMNSTLPSEPANQAEDQNNDQNMQDEKKIFYR